MTGVVERIGDFVTWLVGPWLAIFIVSNVMLHDAVTRPTWWLPYDRCVINAVSCAAIVTFILRARAQKEPTP